MREVLFRGKRADNEEWIEGVPYGEYMICGMNLLRADDEIPMSEYPEFDYVRIIPETIGQHTCLRDKNKVRIFEGDIISKIDEVYGYNLGIVCFGKYGPCYYSETQMGFYIDWSKSKDNLLRRDIGFWAERCEVIGNIYDNPELLKENNNEKRI